MQRIFSTGRILRAFGVGLVVSWIYALVLVQWMVLLSPAALQFELATGVQVTSLGNWIRSQLSKPFTPPSQ